MIGAYYYVWYQNCITYLIACLDETTTKLSSILIVLAWKILIRDQW